MTRIALALLALLFTGSVAHAQSASPDALLRQVAGVLDYLAADYAGAVRAEGDVANQAEYDEQLELVGQARALSLRAGLSQDSGELAMLARIEERMRAKAGPSEVAGLCRLTRTTLMQTHHITLAPSGAVHFERGEQLYQQAACASCHGARGGGDGAAGANLEPRPANFLDAERMLEVSPARAFHAITYGIGGTGMVGFSHLSTSDRWDLAYYVLSLRHSAQDAERGRALMVTRAVGAPLSAEALADSSEKTLLSNLPPELEPDAKSAIVSFLQRSAPFAASGHGATFDVAREKLHDGLEAYEAGNVDEARRLFVSAYLDGVEPNEAALSVRNETLMRQIETAMLGVREAASRGVSNQALRDQVRAAQHLLNEAEATQTSASSTLLGAAAIALREGFEAALLIATLLGLVRKKGKPEHAKFVHFGWFAALPAGLLTWLALGHLIGGLERELAEGIIALLAAFVLLGVTHWVLGQASSKHFFGFLFKRSNEAIAQGSRGAAIAVFGLSFVAAYREAFEVVLFYKAMLLQASGRESLVWLGALLGVAILVVIVLVLRSLGQKLDPRRFMLASSVLLSALALVMVGKGVHALQEAGVIGLHNVLPGLSIPGLGLHGSIEVMAAQLGLLALLIVSALPSLKDSKTAP